jgi:hypothetical protein
MVLVRNHPRSVLIVKAQGLPKYQKGFLGCPNPVHHAVAQVEKLLKSVQPVEEKEETSRQKY